TGVTSYEHVVRYVLIFFFSSSRRHTRWPRDWSSDVSSSDLARTVLPGERVRRRGRGPRRRTRSPGSTVRAAGPPRSGRRSPTREIGRASCRERVLQKVVEVVV